jgi:peptidoglycan/LPS O-acetylase OafA/YrhL
MDLGWVGVVLFYVISGFLITGLLLGSRGEPRYFRRFYARRALRIFPIYWLVLAIAIVFALGTGGATLAPFYALYVQNYFPQIATSFGDGLPLLNHTWTLAIEEQFYWLWPVAVLVFARRRLLWLVAALIAGAPLARLALLVGTGNPYAAVASLPAQADALAAGALLAILIDRETSLATVRLGGLVALALGIVGTGALVARSGLSAFGVTSRWAADPVNVLFLSFLVCALAGVLALTLSTRTLPRVLSAAPLRNTGRISYGLYLYYPLVIVVTRAATAWAGLDGAVGAARVVVGLAHLAVLYVVATVSWRYIERPLLGLRTRVPVGSATLPLRMGNVAAIDPAP